MTCVRLSCQPEQTEGGTGAEGNPTNNVTQPRPRATAPSVGRHLDCFRSEHALLKIHKKGCGGSAGYPPSSSSDVRIYACASRLFLSGSLPGSQSVWYKSATWRLLRIPGATFYVPPLSDRHPSLLPFLHAPRPGSSCRLMGWRRARRSRRRRSHHCPPPTSLSTHFASYTNLFVAPSASTSDSDQRRQRERATSAVRFDDWIKQATVDDDHPGRGRVLGACPAHNLGAALGGLALCGGCQNPFT